MTDKHGLYMTLEAVTGLFTFVIFVNIGVKQRIFHLQINFPSKTHDMGIYPKFDVQINSGL